MAREVTATLMSHLKGKPECRELMNELLSADGVETEGGSTNVPAPRVADAS
jgi:hypothetical protein